MITYWRYNKINITMHKCQIDRIRNDLFVQYSFSRVFYPLLWILIRIGNADPDPGAWKLYVTGRHMFEVMERGGTST